MKLSKKVKDRAISLFEQNDFDVLYVNKKGEFFTSKNLAENSVKNPEKEIEVLRREILMSPGDPTEDAGSTGEGTGDKK